MRILLIQRDRVLADTIGLMLFAEAMRVYPCDEADEAVDLGRRYDFDAIVLDPDLFESATILRDLRAAKVMSPVLVLSDACGVASKVAAFEKGADDYLTKPFHRDEFVARILALVRRSRGLAETSVSIGDLTLRLNSRTVDIAGTPLHLTGREYKFLELLALRKDAVVTKEMFLDHIYGERDEPDMKIIDVYLCKIRKKLFAMGCTARIDTIWGRGHTLAGPRALAA